jgi:hypothetical protein
LRHAPGGALLCLFLFLFVHPMMMAVMVTVLRFFLLFLC